MTYRLACPHCDAAVPSEDVEWYDSETMGEPLGGCPLCDGWATSDLWVEAEPDA